MANDTTIVLNLGVGGDTTDGSVVTDTAITSADGSLTPIKRERVVLGGDAAREQVADLVQTNVAWQLPAYDDEARRQRESMELLLSKANNNYVANDDNTRGSR